MVGWLTKTKKAALGQSSLYLICMEQSVSFLAGHGHRRTGTPPGLHLLKTGCILLRHDLKSRILGLSGNEGEARYALGR